MAPAWARHDPGGPQGSVDDDCSSTGGRSLLRGLASGRSCSQLQTWTTRREVGKDVSTDYVKQRWARHSQRIDAAALSAMCCPSALEPELEHGTRACAGRELHDRSGTTRATNIGPRLGRKKSRVPSPRQERRVMGEARCSSRLSIHLFTHAHCPRIAHRLALVGQMRDTTGRSADRQTRGTCRRGGLHRTSRNAERPSLPGH